VAADLCFISPEAISTPVVTQRKERKRGRKEYSLKLTYRGPKCISFLMPQVAMRGLPLASAHQIALVQ